MAVSSKTYGTVSAVISGAGFIALVLSFASDKWLEASNFEDVGFSNLGLWSVCFDGKYRPPSFVVVSREYEGCWWALNKELDDLRNFLFPKWFVSTQALVTVGLILAIFVVIIQVINFINCFPNSAHKETIKRLLALASGLLLFIAAILLCVAVILFGARATSTRTWLQENDNNFLSWSYGMCILADFLFIIAGMCLILQFLRLRAEKGDPDDSEPKVILTNEPPPATSYRYTPGNNITMSEVPPSQPAYAQRYAKNQNSRPVPRGPDSTFAVSGAGEVYVNRLSEYDEKQNGDYRDGYREQGRRGRPPWQEQKTNADTKISLTELDTSMDGTYMGSDYEKAKKVVHPTLPEYTPRSERKAKQRAVKAASDSDAQDTADKDKKKKKKKDEKGEHKEERKSRSDSKKKRSGSRDRSRSASRSRRKNASESEYSDSESTKKRSRRRSRSRDDSEDGRSRRRSKKGNKKRKRRSRSRSKSRDNNTTYSDSQLDSDSGSVRSRSRRRHNKDSNKYSSDKDLSRKDKKRHSSSNKKNRKKSRDGNISDDKLGSEYSHRSRRKDRDYSDVESKKRIRDFSETESVRSARSRSKPKGTYSSYYE